MNQISNGNINDNREETSSISDSIESDMNLFVGIPKLMEYFYRQLKHFEEWNENRDWLAFHHHHYDWWMFPIDEISSRGNQFQLTQDVINELQNDQIFIKNLRLGVQLMVRSWGWDIDQREFYSQLDDKQKWSYWPVRLYKAGKCMWLFGQYDYYQSLKDLANIIRKKDKLDFYSHRDNCKVDVLEQWLKMERNQ